MKIMCLGSIVVVVFIGILVFVGCVVLFDFGSMIFVLFVFVDIMVIGFKIDFMFVGMIIVGGLSV